MARDIDSPGDMPPVPALGGAIGRHATVACRQGAHDLCRDAGCDCRCHEGIAPDAAHYVIRVTNMPPTELECKCGIRTEGADCLARMSAHVKAGNVE
jgi:hypothetical protein